jgi:xylulose-5-phosphate/fructose-6-phosphate phosphoketolase
MQETLRTSYKQITDIQNQARKENKQIEKPNWPMIILRTPKGWTTIKEMHGKKIEGNHYSHQVVVKEPRIDKDELIALEGWLRSYKFEEIFDKENGFIEEVFDILPSENNRIGNNKHTLGGPAVYRPLDLPDAKDFEVFVGKPSTNNYSSMKTVGEYLNEVFKRNLKHRNFRFFSPDETYSNKLDKIFDSTKRAFVWPHREWDNDMANDGMVIEMLSEHSLQGLIQGYVLTG